MELVVLFVVVLALAGAAVYVRTRRDGGSPTLRRDASAPEPPPRGGLRSQLAKSRRVLAERIAALAGRGSLDDSYWDDVEELLIAADMGVAAATSIVAAVRSTSPSDPDEAQRLISSEIVARLSGRDRSLARTSTPSVVLVVGVNGGGKTTSIAKLASQLKRDGASVLLGAADTFRAAADSQLRTWADRVGVALVGGQPGADPASVAYDALAAARARGVDILIVDTAGRLQSKSNLMDELRKVARVLDREAGAVDEVLLVIDGTTGQNALAQARVFSEAVGVTGIVVTKLDGTAKGGVAFAIEQELDVPVKFIGVGEGVDDLIAFSPEDFVDAIVGR